MRGFRERERECERRLVEVGRGQVEDGSRYNLYRDAGADGVDQLGRVPVGEAETAVGAGAGNILRFRGSVDAVALKREADPGGADGIVGAGRKHQLIGDSFLLGGKGEDFRVELS